jgi:hypothetical protein
MIKEEDIHEYVESSAVRRREREIDQDLEIIKGINSSNDAVNNIIIGITSPVGVLS